MQDQKPDAENVPSGVQAAIDNLGILARRRIEAEIIKPIYEEMVGRFGKPAAREALRAAITKAAVASGKSLAAAETGPIDLKSFAALQPKWRQDDALRIEVLAEEAGKFDFDVVRCRYSEMYKSMGLGEIGEILSCQRDGTFCQGYDPRITLSRTTTIMEGADRCNFRYRMKSGAEAKEG
jgi:L-2-amino-thiazoline-4-carboxylic acid hydrolase